MAELLLDTPLTPEQATYAKAAKTSGETLLSLIEEILDFSKIEAGKLELETRPFALAAMVEEIVELLAPRAQAKGIEIASFVDERLPRGSSATPRACAKCCSISPATPSSSPRPAASRSSSSRANGRRHRLFAVRDTGIGIKRRGPGAHLPRIRAGRRLVARKFGGTGLGLAISKRIVERMGGRIAVDSAPGAARLSRVSCRCRRPPPGRANSRARSCTAPRC